MDETSPTVSLTATLTVKRDSAHSASQHPDSPSEIFVSQSLWRPRGARGVFGGQVVAQALLSACATTPPPLSLHSQHCYFLLAADAAIPITYTVERLRDGKSYVTRLVRASQNGSVVSVLLASFTLPPIALPPFKDGPRPPFGFIPTLSNQSKAPEVPGLSHSLRMAVEPNSSVATASKHGLQSQTPGVTFPNYAERFQIEVGDMLRWDECELEEKRWQRYLDDQGEELKGRARTSVEEYIQVRGPALRARAVLADRLRLSAGEERVLHFDQGREVPTRKACEERAEHVAAGEVGTWREAGYGDDQGGLALLSEVCRTERMGDRWLGDDSVHDGFPIHRYGVPLRRALPRLFPSSGHARLPRPHHPLLSYTGEFRPGHSAAAPDGGGSGGRHLGPRTCEGVAIYARRGAVGRDVAGGSGQGGSRQGGQGVGGGGRGWGHG